MRSCALVLFLLVLAGCSPSGDRSLTFAANGGRTPVFVVLGGFFSCKAPWHDPVDMSMFARTKELIDRISAANDGARVPYLASCFVLSRDAIYTQTDDALDDVAGFHTDELFDSILGWLQTIEGPLELVLVGHSYGGWLALSGVQGLARHHPVRYVATMDPISMVTCAPSTVISAFLGQASEPDEGCTSAPTDLAHAYPKVARTAGGWAQFYQDEYPFLHSTAIGEATSNGHLSYGFGAYSAWQAHKSVDDDDRAWQEIYAAF